MNKDLEYYMGLPYRVEVIEDKEENGYSLRCPELNGCATRTPSESGSQLAWKMESPFRNRRGTRTIAGSSS